MSSFVTRFYNLCIDRDPDTAGLDSWVDYLFDGTLTGADLTYNFIFSPEFLDKGEAAPPWRGGNPWQHRRCSIPPKADPRHRLSHRINSRSDFRLAVDVIIGEIDEAALSFQNGSIS